MYSKLRAQVGVIIAEYGMKQREDAHRASKGLPVLNGLSPYSTVDRILVLMYEELLKEYGLGSRRAAKEAGDE